MQWGCQIGFKTNKKKGQSGLHLSFSYNYADIIFKGKNIAKLYYKKMRDGDTDMVETNMCGP